MCEHAATEHGSQIQALINAFKTRTNLNKSNCPAGITYLGQMIAHDIIPATKKKLTSRNVGPYLTLDSIYGSPNPFDDNHKVWTRSFLDDKGWFKYQQRGDNLRGFDFDRQEVIRNGKQLFVANTPEERNDENIIISQLTVLWMLLHNHLLQKGLTATPEQARTIVVKTFQIVCIEYVLRHILSPDVFEQYFGVQGQNYILGKMASVPTFFSHASWRFGHSMVRESYIFSSAEGAQGLVTSIFKKHTKLSPITAIDWPQFFNLEQSQKAALIDTSLVAGMLHIKQSTTEHDEGADIVQCNLSASTNQEIASGWQYFTHLQKTIPRALHNSLQLSPLTQENFNDSKFLNHGGYDITTLPLWPYILLEAEVTQQGQCLGAIGSILNAEVMRAAICQGPISVYQDDKYNRNEALAGMGSWGAELSTISANDLMDFITKEVKP